VSLCGQCLFAVHYLPLGVLLLGGRPTVFQSNSIDFWYGLIRDLVADSVARVHAGEHAAIGAKEGTRHMVGRLLALFAKTASQPHGTTLFAWRFSNSGSGADCAVDVIPDRALEFLWFAANHGLGGEVQNCAARDHKRSRPFLQCISEGIEYSGLYPRGSWLGVSPRLFSLYQQTICRRSASFLATAEAIALRTGKSVTAKELNRLRRCDPEWDPQLWRILRQSIVASAKLHQLNHSAYLDLFPLRLDLSGIQVERQGRAIVWYFLHKLGELEPTETSVAAPIVDSDRRSRLLYCASRIFRSRMDQLGPDRFDSEILGRFDRGTLRLGWLRHQFTALASVDPNFTYADWVLLTHTAQGVTRVDEVVFQLRLLFTEWFSHGAPESHVPDPLPPSTGLPAAFERLLAGYFRQYTDTRGVPRFRRDILQRLGTRQIGFGWLIARLREQEVDGTVDIPLTAEELESFEYDDHGRPARQERLFQMHLHLANLYQLEATSPLLENAK
jgi:hypothetical protein